MDLLPIHETSQESLPEVKDDINSAYSLSVEAAYINQKFSQQILVRHGNKVSFDDPNTFSNEGDEVASVAYRYRRCKLNNDMQLVAQCEVESVVDVNNQKSFLTLNAVNEFDPKYSCVDWRQKLETQRGAVLATELKNNANKLAKWIAQSILANDDLMRLGYVSRVQHKDHINHVILGVVGYKLRDCAAQINLNTAKMWGIVKSIVDFCIKLNEGKYVLMKDPSKPEVRIYEVPAYTSENDYVEELQCKEFIEGQNPVGIKTFLPVLEKQVNTILLEAENSKSKVEELGTKLAESQQVVNIIARKGPARVQRPETYKKWLVSWDGLHSFVTWKDIMVLLSQIQYFNPWGQGSSKRGGIITVGREDEEHEAKRIGDSENELGIELGIARCELENFDEEEQNGEHEAYMGKINMKKIVNLLEEGK
ncbi:Eukaryotic translation initiation factor 3 subunit D [Hibiscus syriacus]|uniref:Eukaryotic translation initiation factor 3 subunit D n=1 Tax=Hibiscus syriacus TaxID=106335 RepID=A0A6A2YV20_HIBSY|nr:Eukaryotic translation initiation factor 3 subunit D [Hibiscus syriacus]